VLKRGQGSEKHYNFVAWYFSLKSLGILNAYFKGESKDLHNYLRILKTLCLDITGGDRIWRRVMKKEDKDK
jgi:hypothetical protein